MNTRITRKPGQPANYQARKLRQAGKETKSEPMNETRRMSAAEKLSRAFDRHQEISRASREAAKRAHDEFERQWAKKKELEKQHLKPKTTNEDAPVNNVGDGKVAGLGVGQQGEPGVKKMTKKKIIPFKMFVRKQ
jgi:hypothetical protein